MEGFDGFRPDDLVMFQQDGIVMSGGYSVNSILMKGGKPPMTSYFKGGSLERRNDLDSNENEIVEDDANEEDDKKKDPFNNLAVPAGILLIVQQPTQSEYDKKSYANEKYRNCDMLSDDIYDKLFEYASFKGQNKGTNNKGQNKGTNNKGQNKGQNNKITKKNNKGNKDIQKKQTKRNKTKI
jgi:hypothetical protein